MTDFVYDGTPLPNGKVDRFPSPGPTDQYVVAAEWNTSMQAMLDLRTAILNGQYHGMQAAYWKNASGVTQMRTWWDSSNSRLVLAGNAAGTVQYAHINASGDLTLSGSIFASNVGGTNTGDVTIGTANGLSLLGQTLSMDLAGPTTIGTVGVGSQVFAGDKTFTSTTSMTTANTLLSITPPSTVSGVSYTDPSVQIDYTNAGTAQFMLQLGGKTGTTWEMALGVYTGRFPIISSRANDIFVSMASGKSLSPLSGNNDLGMSSNLWRRLYVQDGVLNANGTSPSHVGVKVGLSTADASVVSGAKLVSFRTGVGGSEVEYGYWSKGSGLVISKPPVLNEPAFYLPAPVSTGSYGLAGAMVWSGSNSYLRLSTTALDLYSYAVPLVLSAAFSTAELRGGIGSTSGDIVAKVGTTVADASVNVNAKLASFRTGIGGTEVESLAVYKGGILGGGSGYLRMNDTIGSQLDYGSSIINLTSTLAKYTAATEARMYGRIGSSASDVVVKIGTNLADASVPVGATYTSIGTNVDGTMVEYAKFRKPGLFVGALELDSQNLPNAADLLLKTGRLAFIANGGENYIVYGGSLATYTTTNRAFVIGTNGDAYLTGLPNQSMVDVIAGASGTVGRRGVNIRSAMAAAATDICVAVGATPADASVHASAKLFSVRTGLNSGSEVESLAVRKDGIIVGGALQTAKLTLNDSIGASLDYGGAYCRVGSNSFTVATPYLAISGYSARAAIFSGSTLSMEVAGGLGASVSDVSTKIGTTVADASVNAAAKLMSVRTGIGATEVEKAYFAKDGGLWNINGRLGSFSSPNVYVWCDSGAARLVYSSTVLEVVAGTMQLFDGSAYSFKVTSGRIDQAGTNSSGTPGAATINKPTGVSAIANGASSVTITNSLVTASSRVMITWHDDHGAARTWVTRAAGSFTVNISSNATADAAFSWEVSSLL